MACDPRRPLADTIYFGGGTPAVARARRSSVRRRSMLWAFDVAADREVTLEANPESVTERTVEGAIEAAGVNRLGFGVNRSETTSCGVCRRLPGAARRANGFRRSPPGGIRERRSRPDDVAARSAGRRLARLGRRGCCAFAPAAAYAVSVWRSSQTRRSKTRWHAHGARRHRTGDAAAMYPGGRGAGLDGQRRVRLVRDFQRGAVQPAVTSQRQKSGVMAIGSRFGCARCAF